ncbi:hypothetical protein Vi05172_g4969 [Venturia inaequalis]|nr:hypothetical protein Vi05172_g4969 [Venturia inaequalis]
MGTQQDPLERIDYNRAFNHLLQIPRIPSGGPRAYKKTPQGRDFTRAMPPGWNPLM